MDLNRDLCVLNKYGMVRPPDDGVQLETPQAQSGSSSVGVPPATGGSTSCETPPENVPIPGPPLIDITTEAGLATDQPNQAARSAGATTSGSKAVDEDSENMPHLTDGSIQAEAVVDTKGPRELTGNHHRQDAEHVLHLREHRTTNADESYIFSPSMSAKFGVGDYWRDFHQGKSLVEGS